MLQDFELGKRLELETSNGALIEMGKKYGLPTPVNEQIVEMVNARIRERRKEAGRSRERLDARPGVINGQPDTPDPK